MLDVSVHASLGSALREAVQRHPDETCLIEANRDRENARFTYAAFEAEAAALAGGIQATGFKPGDRAAIIMTNQSKWPLSAWAMFHIGGVLVPIDYKLTGAEHLALLKHSHARVLVTEYHLWRAMSSADDFEDCRPETVLVTEAPPGADLLGATRWEDCRGDSVQFQDRGRADAACIVYSSGTGGRPKGCVLTHDNYLQQANALMAMYVFEPGDRYLSILPTNHAIDFMVGFIGPFLCGATVVHLRSLRPEFIKAAFPKYGITYMALVPMVLKSLERGLRDRFNELPNGKRRMLNAMIGLNRLLTRTGPKLGMSRRLLRPIHEQFGGKLKAFFVGGAFTEPETLRFFYDLGIPVANGYGLTEAGTAITLNDMAPFRDDTVGKPLPGVELRIDNADHTGIGEVAVRSPMLMSHYLDDPELTAETLVEGWLITGDLGRVDHMGHLQLFGRKKNMIVTAGGKNVYPEDVENAFAGLPVKEYCVFAANYLWPDTSKRDENLVMVVRLDAGQTFDEAVQQALTKCNRSLLDFKRVTRYVVWDTDFPRTASMKVKRDMLAKQIAESLDGPTGEVAP